MTVHVGSIPLAMQFRIPFDEDMPMLHCVRDIGGLYDVFNNITIAALLLRSTSRTNASEAFAIGVTAEYTCLQVSKSRFHEQLPRHHHRVLFGDRFVVLENTGNPGPLLGQL